MSKKAQKPEDQTALLENIVAQLKTVSYTHLTLPTKLLV